MADKRKGKKRKEDNENEEDKATKDEYKVAKWLKKNVPTKKTKFLYHNVEYFTGSKAVDALLESSFAETLFPTRDAVVRFLDTMLRHKFFHRALKVIVTEEELLARKRKKKGDKDKDKSKEKEKESDPKEDAAESSHAEGKVDDPSASPKPQKDVKKKRKIRLEMHHRQIFEDGLDAYVWIYDPIPLHYWIFGTLMVLGAIGICLFPLWPPEVRKGVYYLSMVGAGFLCVIIALAVIRVIVFCLLWCLTWGRHHLWLLPNLTEDVGFFASFWPLYQYEYKGPEEKSGRSKRKKKDKDSDDEQEDDKPEGDEPENEEGTREEGEEETGDKTEGEERNSRSESESESSSQKSQTGRDFEIVDKNDVDES